MRRVNTLVRYRYLRKRRGVEYTIFETSLLVHLHLVPPLHAHHPLVHGDLELVGPVLAVSRLTSILLSSSLVLINSLSLLLNRSSCLRGALREGSIHLRGNIQPSSYLALLSCLARLLASSLLNSLPSSIPGSSMMLFFMHALSLKSSSKRFHMSLLS